MKHFTAILAALAVTLVISLGVYAMGGSAFFSGGDTAAARSVAAAQSTASSTSTSAGVTANTPSRGRGRSARNVDGQGEGSNQGGVDLFGGTN
jgi:hypothetical protein